MDISIVFVTFGLTLVLPGLIVADNNMTISRFMSHEKHYFVVINRDGNSLDSEYFCQSEFDGRLAIVRSNEDLFHINAELRLLNTLGKVGSNSSNELWVGGSTNITAGMLNVTVDVLSKVSTGPNCIVMADRQTEEIKMMYNLYPKQCDNITENFICEADRVPPFKHLYLESAGQCKDDTRVTNASVYTSQDGCRALGGVIVNDLLIDNVVLCEFDVCGADSMGSREGIVLAGIKSCPGENAQTVYAGPMYGSPCLKLGGRELSLSEPGISYEQSYCQLEACKKTKVPNSSTVTFSSNEGNCSADNLAGKVAVMANSSENCADMHAKLRRQSSASTYQMRCWLNLCHISVPDCKTSQMGKNYTGKMSVTVSGKTCQRWDSQVPHSHGNNNPNWFPDRTIADAANYCRNPGDWMEGPFCYTTDPNTVWEICELPFCEGHKHSIEDFKIGKTRYIYVPGRHTNPTEYCAKAYGASPPVMKGDWEVESLSTWLVHLNLNGEIKKQEVFIGGRAPVGTATGKIITDYGSITKNAQEGPCLLLSNWDANSRSYNGTKFLQYTDNCPYYYDSFLCEVSETRIEHYEVYGGIPQMGVHEQDSCVNSCQEGCLAVGYDSLEESCWHYSTDTTSPGRAKWNFLYVQKAQSVCHNFLILTDQKVVMNASSLRNEDDQRVVSAEQAMITSKTLTTDDGISPGAWIPATFDSQQWVQAQFSQPWMMYGLIVMGMEGVEGSMIKTFKMQTGTNPDCSDLVDYGTQGVTTFHGGQSDSLTIILERSITVHCVRIKPLTWNNMIALRFDVIGCIESNNIALGGKVSPSEGEKKTASWKVIDGFSTALPSWGGCVTSNTQNNPWFAVELKEFYDVQSITLYSSRECCDGQLRDISVKVLSVPASGTLFTRENECGYISTPVLGSQVQKVTCSPIKTGRYVQIQKNALSSQIALCEVKVYGFKSLLQNLAVRKTAHQVNDLRTTAGASKAVDGDRSGNYNHGSCSATAGSSDSQWWMVDLGDTYTVKTIVIYTRSEGTAVTRDLAMYVGDSSDDSELIDNSNLCATQKEQPPKGAVLQKTCSTPLNGRYVKIVMKQKTFLYLCEVEVLAEPLRVLTYGGNAEGAQCQLPFTYKNKTYYSCINNDRDGRFWCSSTRNYDSDKMWGYCLDVSLWGGRTQTEGLVLVRGADNTMTWGTVCDDDWDDKDAKVVCKLLGFPDGFAVYPPFFASGPGIVAIGNVNCNGSEESIMSCPHQVKPKHCTHYEDAAVQCEQHDIWPSFGYPSVKRKQQDTLDEGIFILPESQEIAVPGRVLSWRFYSMKQEAESQLQLQIWRRIYDLQGKRFLLVGSVDVSNALKDDSEVTVVDPQLIHVQSGDLIGFAFKKGNPIPYDHSFKCGHHGRVAYSKNTTVPVGGIISFIDKNDDQLGCRLFSLFVKIEVQALQTLHEFLFEGKMYRIITAPNTKESADNLCRKTFGSSGHVLHFGSVTEYKFVRGFLQDAAIKGEFWLKNTIEDGTAVAGEDWAPCQPEEGKICLIISNLNKDGKYVWKSSSCMDKHYFICESDPPVMTSTTTNNKPSLTTTSKPRPKTTSTVNAAKVTGTKSPVRRWPIVVGLLVPAIIIGIVVIVVVVVLKYKRDGKKLFDYPLIVQDAGLVESHSEEQLSVTSEPSKGSVTLHKNNNDMQEF